jgi:hypothetical protein
MIEYDDDGKERFGYTLSSEGKDPEKVISIFLGNVQYVEYRYRQIVSNQRCSLATQLQGLFELLPNEAQRSLTDDLSSLIAEIVRIRNRYAHGKFEEPTPSIARVHTLSIKVAVLLSFLEYPVDDPSNALWTKRANPFLQRLEQTDVPAGNRATVRAQRKPARQERHANVAASRSKI